MPLKTSHEALRSLDIIFRMSKGSEVCGLAYLIGAELDGGFGHNLEHIQAITFGRVSKAGDT
jgi:hypothetical protein